MASALSWEKLCEHAGLSEYEAKLYVSLVTEGASGARRLSMVCGVPRTKVYGALKKLIERGLVIEMPEEPRRFAPMSPADAFDAFLQSYEKKARDLYLVVSSLESAYEETKSLIKPQKEEVWIIRGRSEILQKVREMLSRAERVVNITTTENGLILLYKACNRLFDELAERGVKVRIVAPVGSSDQNAVQELRYVCEIKHLNICSSTLYVCVDDCEILLANLIPDDFSAISDKDVGAFTKNPILCALMSRLLLEPEKEVLSSPDALKPLK